MTLITDELATLVKQAVARAIDSGELPPEAASVSPSLEAPRNKDFGDFACNLALALARPARMQPREVAARILKHLPVGGNLIGRVEIAGPGFMNFYLKPQWLQDNLVTIEEQDTAYGFSDSYQGEKILIEFVSANPTGPISVVNGRAAALGDSLGNLLKACGAEVSREFYVNDALNSTQLDLMGESLAVRYLQRLGHDVALPEEGYQGEYLVEIADELVREFGRRYEGLSEEERKSVFRQLAISRMIEQQKRDLEAFGVVFDRWFYESELYEQGKVRQAIEQMKAAGYAYEKDGAIWLRSTMLSGDDQDRVLVRSNEKETYVAADAAYHKDKFDRGFTRLIDIWGADHHGYVARLKAGIAALGYDPDKCQIILTQMVLLIRDGEPVRGSKRAGDIIPLIDLVNEIGKDAARFYCLLNSYETTATFDLELAKKQSSENPVYYAQYAHARCCNVFLRAREMGITVPPARSVDRSVLTHEKELDLLRKLADYPAEVQQAADMLAPHRLTAFVREIGQALHQFYEECPALKEGVSPHLRDARLAVFNATRIVVRNLLGLLGVSAPEKM
ncbi:MAG TPA: arginine--tRNA ligase [Chthonomonadales bacterium]|nr:arginine--tRNA ligase [Chthonomonadales bacterium]